ncbi:unnamed protein product [Diplocarpon coronariae]
MLGVEGSCPRVFLMAVSPISTHLIEMEIRRLYKRFGYPSLNTYIRPLNFIIYDYSINFNLAEFKSSLRFIRITLKLVLIKAHYSIGKVERYHRPLRCAFKIIIAKHPRLSDDKRLQIAIKAVNNIARPNRIIPTLLIFKAYLRLIKLDLSNPLVE